MQEGLSDFEMNKVSRVAPRPPDTTIIGTKLVFRNRLDQYGTITRYKAWLVAQGYKQEEGIDYSLQGLARLETIRLFLAYATHKEFKVFQMDVISAFLNGKLSEKVHVAQPLVAASLLERSFKGPEESCHKTA